MYDEFPQGEAVRGLSSPVWLTVVSDLQVIRSGSRIFELFCLVLLLGQLRHT